MFFKHCEMKDYIQIKWTMMVHIKIHLRLLNYYYYFKIIA